ncbi:MAG: myo-inosose-2 dehydratase [Shimia sp.]
MMVRVGISPICWQNDDLPDLTADYTMEQALREAREIGYTGVERGQRMPKETEALAAYLTEYDIALCGGWCSGNLLVNDVETEKTAVRRQLDQFIALEAPCIVYAECSNTIQGRQDVALSKRPTLSSADMRAYGEKLTLLAEWMAAEGMPMAYHHHMGTIIESEDDVDGLMGATGEAVGLCFDTGHLLFGGGDVQATMDRWQHRIRHVHFKDIRSDVVVEVRAMDRSFLDAVVAGAFTVPGDGVIAYQPIADRLAAMSYDGWIVVEAEQDPAKAPPKDYSAKGYAHILNVCARARLEVAR